jgi:SNF family Na+-dependent transporter
LALLLFAQWPLRDAVQAFSRQANDAAQILFAVYSAAAITAASRSKSHLASVKYSDVAIKSIPSWRAWAILACVGPWAVFMLWTAVPQMLGAVVGLEKFSETLTPGYFIIRIALVLLALLVFADAVADAFSGLIKHRGPGP